MTYKWKDGARIKADANEAAAVMNALEAEGNLTAKGLLEASRPEDAPLHDEFEWRDSEAAERWREHQARNIINSIVVVKDQGETVRQFFKIATNDANYCSIDAIMTHEDSRDALLRQAKRELTAFAEKYKQLEELACVFAAISQISA